MRPIHSHPCTLSQTTPPSGNHSTTTLTFAIDLGEVEPSNDRGGGTVPRPPWWPWHRFLIYFSR
jgi:hypothetical protein